MAGASPTKLSTLFADSAEYAKTMGWIWVDSQEPPTGAPWETAPHSSGGKAASGYPPAEESTTLKHSGIGKGKESVGLSSWMRGSGRQYLDSKCSGKSQYSEGEWAWLDLHLKRNF